jgi:hypothetical protein
MNESIPMRNLVVASTGAVVGAILGYFAFFWIARQGFYALVAPGALLGMGAGLLVKDKSIPRALVCAVAALALDLFVEWRFRPFVTDPSLGYFLAHVHQLQPLTLLMVAAGAALGGWLALGKERLK